MKNDLTILYIASTGRTGSTILEMLLHAIDGCWSMGEVYALAMEMKRDALCGCGVPISSCNFWSQLISDLPWLKDIEAPYARFRDTFEGGKFFRIPELIPIIQGDLAREKTRDELFCLQNHLLFQGLLRLVNRFYPEYCPVRVLIDSSKDFYRLNHLSLCRDKFTLKVIHMVRDPRGYLFSNMKGKNINNINRFYFIIRILTKYVLENIIIERICKYFPSSSRYRLRYEDLVLNPEKELIQIINWLGIQLDKIDLNQFREKDNHAIAGNITRHISGKIVYDDAWTKGLSSSIKQFSFLFTLPVASRYGYKLKE